MALTLLSTRLGLVSRRCCSSSLRRHHFCSLDPARCCHGKKVSIIGIGGLVHLGIQWAVALKCNKVITISTSDSKREEDKKLVATKFVYSKNEEDCPNADWGAFLNLVANNSMIVLLELPQAPLTILQRSNVSPWIEKMPTSDANTAVKHVMETTTA
ncbi:hypothetical protein BGZ83_001511 [Gryganskiella cystojenkinii]|nr:hypothetical protein BGZ83_001511 [Gryganskiella cystojenkinii]